MWSRGNANTRLMVNSQRKWYGDSIQTIFDTQHVRKPVHTPLDMNARYHRLLLKNFFFEGDDPDSCKANPFRKPTSFTIPPDRDNFLDTFINLVDRETKKSGRSLGKCSLYVPVVCVVLLSFEIGMHGGDIKEFLRNKVSSLKVALDELRLQPLGGDLLASGRQKLKMVQGDYKEKKRSVLFLNDEWGTSKGGISSVNRQLALQARDAGYVVYVTVLDPPSDQDKQDAVDNGINVITAETIPDVDQDVNLNMLNIAHQRYFPLLEKYMTNLNVIIGHVPITSGGALNIRQERFPNAKVHLFTHVIPQDTDFHRGRSYKLSDIETKVDTIIQQAEQADLIFSVGPKVYKKFKNEFRGSEVNDNKHKEFIPTPDSSFFDVNLKPFTKHDAYEILTVGRVSNVEKLKGYDIVAAALGKVAARSNDFIGGLLWRIRGISDENKDKSLGYIEKHLNCKLLEIYPLQYGTQEQVARDIHKSRLFIMPSRTEPFGMIALEAIAAGIPVLVTENSGLADYLREYFPKHIHEAMIVSKLGKSDIDLESDINNWADRITDALFTKYDDTFDLAKEVKEKLKKMKDQQSTQIFKNELLKLRQRQV